MKTRKCIILCCILLVIMFFITRDRTPAYGENELIQECYAPNGLMKLKIYQGPPDDAVMVDYYVVGEIEYKKEYFFMNITKKEVIYYQYHEEFEEAYWIDDGIVVINGREIEIIDKKTWIDN